MRCWLLVSIVLALGCRGGGGGGGGTDPDTDTDGGEPARFWIDFDDGTLTLSLMRDEDALLRFPADGFQLGVVAQVDDMASYDPVYAMDVAWVGVTDAVRVDGGVLALELAFDGGATATLRIDESASGRFAASWVPGAEGQAVVAFRMRARTDASEGYYGLGEVFDTPNHRGKARAMQLEPDLAFESSYNEAHVPIPLLVGTTGWGLFVQDRHAGLFEVATSEDDLVQVTFGLGPHGDGGLAFHLFGAEHPLDVTAHYYAVTGAPALPSRWALGPWIWRNENEDQAQVISDANSIRDLDLATSALWIDRPYATGVNTFDFQAQKFPDPDAMIATLHDLGFRLALWHTPYVSNMEEPATDLHAEAEAAGYFPPEVGVVLNAWGEPIDLTNPDAYDWWQSHVRSYTDRGVEGFKLDYGEDVVTGLGPGRIPWRFADGSDERTMQSAYQLLYHRVYAETLGPDAGFLLCRGGTYGDQVNVSVIWPGDLDADMSAYGDDRGGTLGVGGLQAAVVAGTSLGPSGFPLFASDTGGYRDAPPDKETFVRWFQHTALTPVMQIGTASSDVAWEFTAENGFDDEMLGWYREFTRLHLRLFPYLWTHVQRLEGDGRPIQRAVGLAYPELGVHPPHDYLLGDALLVAPVVRHGARERTLTLPPGRWIDWFDGTVYEGGGSITVAAPLGKLPLFLREAGIVPLLRPSIDSLSPTTAPERVDSYATTPGVLYPRLVPGPASSFELFDGSAIEQELADDRLTVVVRDGAELREGMVLEILAVPDEPTEVELDGAGLAEVADPAASAMGWSFSTERGGVLLVRTPPGEHTLTVAW